jgi:hypothetical protein
VISNDLADWDLVPYGKTVSLYKADGRGPETPVNVVMYPQSALQGGYSPGIDQEFYGHIIVNPRTLDLGLVLTAKLFTIGVWNLTGYDRRLLSWSVVGLDGVTITNPDGYPVRYGPLAYRDYQVTVGTIGAPQISGSITFNFEGISTGVDTNITGSRLIVFSFEPNWREPITENLEWLTDVLTSHNDREQRMALRQDPRRAMKYLFTFETQNKVNLFQGQLWGWQQQVFVVPIWPDWQFLSANIGIGTTVVNVNTQLRDFAVSNLVLLWRDYLTWEVVEIQSLTSSQITLKKANICAWTTRDRIIPIRLGRLSRSLQIARPTATLAEATLSFSYEVGSAVSANRLGTSTWLQFQGLDVLTLPPNVADGDPDEAYERDFDTVDQGKGTWFVSDHSDGPMISRPYKWLLKTRQEIMNFLAFLEVRKGKAIPFWMPTWSKDLEQVQDMGASDLNILIKNIGYTRYIKHHTNRSMLIFYPSDGSAPIVKTITGCGESSNNTETLSLDTSFGVIKHPADFKAISFLTYCRMDQDAFELTWHTDSIAEVSFRVREVLQ